MCDPLPRPTPAEQNAGAVHPLPQRGEGGNLHKAKNLMQMQKLRCPGQIATDLAAFPSSQRTKLFPHGEVCKRIMSLWCATQKRESRTRKGEVRGSRCGLIRAPA
jgi:hypothetical protein